MGRQDRSHHRPRTRSDPSLHTRRAVELFLKTAPAIDVILLKVARLRGEDESVVAEATRRNAEALFGA
jgi:hypothetical protein